MSTPIRVLFLCTHNSARSQMAEGLLRAMGGGAYQAHSAGTLATSVRPEAMAAMSEIGIDIGAQSSKSLDRYLGAELDWLITVCDDAREACPTLPGVRRQLHWSIADPVVVEDPEKRAKAFQQVAAELQIRIRYLLLLPHPGTGERFTGGR